MPINSDWPEPHNKKQIDPNGERMSVVTIQEALSGTLSIDSNITIKGWLRTRRDSKAGISFLQINDGSCFDSIQVVAGKDLGNYDSEISRLTTGCAIVATGKLSASQGRGQQFEIQASDVTLVGDVENPEEYPVQAKRHSFEYLREVAHLRPRTNTFGAIARVRHRLARAIHEYFDAHGYYWINTPILTGSDCEGAGDMFRVSALDLANLPRNDRGKIDYSADFFGTESFLTVSGQLNVECYCLAMSRVYTFGPTFRAENSNTSRHLAEFWMVEPELAFTDLNGLIDLAEDFLKVLARRILEDCPDDMAFFAKRIESTAISRLEALQEKAFERVDYSDAIDILQASGKRFEFRVAWGQDLQTEHERFLTEEHFKRPVVVRNYPKQIKAFYMRENDDGKTVAAMDVLTPGMGEIIGGSQREERIGHLRQRMIDAGMDLDHYGWYLDLRRYGSVPHSGFGLGFERLVNYVTGMANIRDVIPFPRTPKNIAF